MLIIYLTTLGLVRFLIEDPPDKNDDEQDRDYLIGRQTKNNSDYLCQHHVMNCLSDSLYDVYVSIKYLPIQPKAITISRGATLFP